MMLAVFGAVRGRFDVLSRVLDEVEDEGIQTVVCTGNIAVGPDPDGVINLLRDRQVHVVQGDTDRQLARLVRNRKRLERVLDARALATLVLAHLSCSSANL